MKQIKLQQGDTFTMTFVVKENGEPKDIRDNEDLAVGFYDEYGQKEVLKYRVNGDVFKKLEGVGKYQVYVSNQITKNFVGSIDVEIVVYDIETLNPNVSHADKILKMFFEERRINEDL